MGDDECSGVDGSQLSDDFPHFSSFKGDIDKIFFGSGIDALAFDERGPPFEFVRDEVHNFLFFFRYDHQCEVGVDHFQDVVDG